MMGEYDGYKAQAAKEYADAIRSQRLSARALQACMADAISALDGLTAVRYDRESVQSSGMEHGDDAVAAKLADVEEATARYRAEKEEWQAMLVEFDRCTGELPSPERDLLRLRYAHAYPWHVVAGVLCYSEVYARGAINRRALSLLYDVMPIEYRDPRHQAI